VTRGAASERERLFTEVRRVETLLRAALGMVEETRNELPASPAAAPTDPPLEHWPRRQDTREFQAVQPPRIEEHPKLPPVQPVPDEVDDGPSTARDFAWG